MILTVFAVWLCVCVCVYVCVYVNCHLLECEENVPFDCSEANSQESVGSEIDT
jgi:hypothetical protein